MLVELTFVSITFCRRQSLPIPAHAEAQQSVLCAAQQEQAEHTDQQQQDSYDAWQPAEQQIERPETPQQYNQEQLRASTGVLTPLSQCGSGSDDLSDDQGEVEPWATLPEGVFAEVMNRVSCKDAG